MFEIDSFNALDKTQDFDYLVAFCETNNCISPYVGGLKEGNAFFSRCAISQKRLINSPSRIKAHKATQIIKRKKNKVTEQSGSCFFVCLIKTVH